MKIPRLTFVATYAITMAMLISAFSGLITFGESHVHTEEMARQSEELKTISLYFHEDGANGKLLTTPSSGGNNRGTSWVFTTNPLEKTISVDFPSKRLDVYNVNMGMAFQAATVTVRFYDDNVLLGERTQTVGTSIISDWSINLNIANSTYVFDSGSTMKFEISSSNSVTLQTGSSTRIDLRCMPVSLDVDTYDYLNGKQKEFHPNWPSHMTIVNFEGHAYDAFGSSDIANITIVIANYEGEILEPATKAYRTGDRFNYTWNYSKEDKGLLKSGTYTATISAKDTQNNYYNITTQFKIMKYGLFLEVEDLIYKTSNSTDARITVSILNSGNENTNIELSVISPLAGTGWNAGFEPASTGVIEKGAWTQVMFIVNTTPEVPIYDTISIDIKAVAADDPEKAQAVAKVRVQKVVDTSFSLTPPSLLEKYVEYGAQVEYDFILENKGTNDTKLEVSWNSVSPWSVTVNDLEYENGRYYLTLPLNTPLVRTLKITAPVVVADSQKVAVVTLTVTSVVDPTLTKSFTTTTTCTPGLQFDLLKPESVTLNGTAGISGVSYPSATFTFNLTNTGSSERAFKIYCNYADLGGWIVKVSIPSMGIKPTIKTVETGKMNSGASVTVIVEVFPSLNAQANMNPGYSIKVNCSSLYDTQRYIERTIKVMLKPAYNLSLSLDSSDVVNPNMGLVEPIAEFVFTVRNLGNDATQVVFTIATGMPEGWKVKIDNVTRQSITFELESGRGKEITVSIYPSLKAKHGTKQMFTVTATSANVECSPIDITVAIEKNQNQIFWDALGENLLFVVMSSVLLLISIALAIKRHW